MYAVALSNDCADSFAHYLTSKSFNFGVVVKSASTVVWSVLCHVPGKKWGRSESHLPDGSARTVSGK